MELPYKRLPEPKWFGITQIPQQSIVILFSKYPNTAVPNLFMLTYPQTEK